MIVMVLAYANKSNSMHNMMMTTLYTRQTTPCTNAQDSKIVLDRKHHNAKLSYGSFVTWILKLCRVYLLLGILLLSQAQPVYDSQNSGYTNTALTMLTCQ